MIFYSYEVAKLAAGRIPHGQCRPYAHVNFIFGPRRFLSFDLTSGMVMSNPTLRLPMVVSQVGKGNS